MPSQGWDRRAGGRWASPQGAGRDPRPRSPPACTRSSGGELESSPPTIPGGCPGLGTGSVARCKEAGALGRGLVMHRARCQLALSPSPGRSELPTGPDCPLPAPGVPGRCQGFIAGCWPRPLSWGRPRWALIAALHPACLFARRWALLLSGICWLSAAPHRAGAGGRGQPAPSHVPQAAGTASSPAALAARTGQSGSPVPPLPNLCLGGGLQPPTRPWARPSSRHRGTEFPQPPSKEGSALCGSARAPDGGVSLSPGGPCRVPCSRGGGSAPYASPRAELKCSGL